MATMTLSDVLQDDRVIHVRPDDTLIFRFNQRLTEEIADAVREKIAARLAPDIRFLVIDETVEVQVLRPTWEG